MRTKTASRRWPALLLILAVAAAARPAEWAQPIELEGVPNLYRVSEILYRSAQPTAAGMRALEKLGIRTVVSLRAQHSDADELAGTGLRGVSLPMVALNPTEESLAQFLRILNDPTQTPVLVHCQRGADRTGLVVAVYRIAMQGWSKENALREMVEGGYGYNEALINLQETIKNLDVAAIQRKAGIGETSQGAQP